MYQSQFNKSNSVLRHATQINHNVIHATNMAHLSKQTSLGKVNIIFSQHV